ncbi:MAG: hypothetical protein Ta2G_16160 [Termitinemataceae bacterium]|nr:MAG: hypothetical protein Ta2G_16160 [Termitinemataceae bacterium]
MNKRRFTTLAAGVAAALLVSALAFTMVSCGGDFTQEDLDAEYAKGLADGQAAVKSGSTDAALVDLLKATNVDIGTPQEYVIGTADGAGTVAAITSAGIIAYNVGDGKTVTISNGAIKNALALLKTSGDKFKVSSAYIPGLGDRAWISEFTPVEASANALTDVQIKSLFNVVSTLVDLDNASVTLKLNDATVPAGCTLKATSAEIEVGKTLTVNGIFTATTSLTVSGKLALGAGVTFTSPATLKLSLHATDATKDGVIALIGPNVNFKLKASAPTALFASFKTAADTPANAERLIAVRPKRVISSGADTATANTLWTNYTPIAADSSVTAASGVIFASNAATFSAGFPIGFTGEAASNAVINASAAVFQTGSVAVTSSTGAVSVS